MTDQTLPSLRGRLEYLEREARHLRDNIAQIEAEAQAEVERQRAVRELLEFVQVKFPDDSTLYTYRVDEPCVAGDYVLVYSPRSLRIEIVKVFAPGPGRWAKTNRRADGSIPSKFAARASFTSVIYGHTSLSYLRQTT